MSKEEIWDGPALGHLEGVEKEISDAMYGAAYAASDLIGKCEALRDSVPEERKGEMDFAISEARNLAVKLHEWADAKHEEFQEKKRAGKQEDGSQ